MRNVITLIGTREERLLVSGGRRGKKGLGEGMGNGEWGMGNVGVWKCTWERGYGE